MKTIVLNENRIRVRKRELWASSDDAPFFEAEVGSPARGRGTDDHVIHELEL